MVESSSSGKGLFRDSIRGDWVRDRTIMAREMLAVQVTSQLKSLPLFLNSGWRITKFASQPVTHRGTSQKDIHTFVSPLYNIDVELLTDRAPRCTWNPNLNPKFHNPEHSHPQSASLHKLDQASKRTASAYELAEFFIDSPFLKPSWADLYQPPY